MIITIIFRLRIPSASHRIIWKTSILESTFIKPCQLCLKTLKEQGRVMHPVHKYKMSQGTEKMTDRRRKKEEKWKNEDGRTRLANYGIMGQFQRKWMSIKLVSVVASSANLALDCCFHLLKIYYIHIAPFLILGPVTPLKSSHKEHFKCCKCISDKPFSIQISNRIRGFRILYIYSSSHSF